MIVSHNVCVFLYYNFLRVVVHYYGSKNTVHQKTYGEDDKLDINFQDILSHHVPAIGT